MNLNLNTKKIAALSAAILSSALVLQSAHAKNVRTDGYNATRERERTQSRLEGDSRAEAEAIATSGSQQRSATQVVTGIGGFSAANGDISAQLIAAGLQPNENLDFTGVDGAAALVAELGGSTQVTLLTVAQAIDKKGDLGASLGIKVEEIVSAAALSQAALTNQVGVVVEQEVAVIGALAEKCKGS